ncbi:hypothetical protein ES708_16545 [subsurface metagenome]
MPLSKARNRDRMRKTRLHKRLLPPQTSKPVQPIPKYLFIGPQPTVQPRIDADGNPIYEEG